MNWKEDLIKYRREKAVDTLEDADLLFRNKRFFSAVNRIYYSMFYEVIALLLREGLSTSKHSGVMAIFQKEFIKTGKVNVDMGKFYARMVPGTPVQEVLEKALPDSGSCVIFIGPSGLGNYQNEEARIASLGDRQNSIPTENENIPIKTAAGKKKPELCIGNLRMKRLLGEKN